MSYSPRTILLVVLAIVAFAGNSLLCRLALADREIDASTFTFVRLASGALLLGLYMRPSTDSTTSRFTVYSATALYIYAAAFSYAYLSLAAGTGALLLFGAVQITMIGWGVTRGERMSGVQWAGFALALAGLVVLLLPGLSVPSPLGATLMISAGAAWGVYSLLGKSAPHPVRATASNFVLGAPVAGLALLAVWSFNLHPIHASPAGFVYAVTSGALTSGVGYVLWYLVLPSLHATTAATVQLSVPLITAMGATVLLGEVFSVRLVAAMIAVLGGVGIVIRSRVVRAP